MNDFTGRVRTPYDNFKMDYHYWVTFFYEKVTFQCKGIKGSIKEWKFFVLYNLDSCHVYKSFKIDDIGALVGKFHCYDITEQDIVTFKVHLKCCELDIHSHKKLHILSRLSEPCQGLEKIGKSMVFYVRSLHLIFNFCPSCCRHPISHPQICVCIFMRKIQKIW